MRKKICIFFGVLVVAAGTFLSAEAFTSHGARFNTEYKTSGTPLDSCITCHAKRSLKENPYGADLKNAGYALNAIEHEDSDGDGFSNIAEILAGTFPGDPRSSPARPANPQ